MIINIDGIKDVSITVEKSIKYLDDAKKALESISAPSDFKYASIIKKLPLEIQSIKSAIKEFQSWSNTTITKFINVEKKNNSILLEMFGEQYRGIYLNYENADKSYNYSDLMSQIQKLCGTHSIISSKETKTIINQMLKELLGGSKKLKNWYEGTFLGKKTKSLVENAYGSYQEYLEFKNTCAEVVGTNISMKEYLEYKMILEKYYNMPMDEYLQYLNITAAYNASPEEFFKCLANQEAGRFGTDQGIFNRTITSSTIDESNKAEYERLEKKLVEEYNMSYEDANELMTLMDSKGVCTYASAADAITIQYADRPKEFEKEFGFPLYIKNSDGEIQINSGELLLDMFIENNTNKGTPILIREKDGTLRINDDAIIDVDPKTGPRWSDQEYMNSDELEEYTNGKLTESRVFRVSQGEITDENIKIIKAIVEKKLEENAVLRMGIRDVIDTDDDNTTVILENYETGQETTFQNGGHRVYVIGHTEEGILVSTWGDEYLIRYSDMVEQKFEVDLKEVEEKKFKFWPFF